MFSRASFGKARNRAFRPFSLFSTIFSISSEIQKWRRRSQPEAVTWEEFLRPKDAVQHKPHRDQDLFRAIDPRRSRHFRASIHGPMTRMTRRKRGIPAPFRLVPPNTQGITSSAARTLQSRKKKKRVAQAPRREGISRVELASSRSSYFFACESAMVPRAPTMNRSLKPATMAITATTAKSSANFPSKNTLSWVLANSSV